MEHHTPADAFRRSGSEPDLRAFNSRRECQYALGAPSSCYNLNTSNGILKMSAALRTLVLNADYRPLCVWPLSFMTAQEAIKTVCRDRAAVVEEWDAVFRSATTQIRVPKVIALRHYAPIDSAPKFCRRSILLRDRFRCQYCGEKFDAADLTFDHVIPRSAGGKTEWTNILTACVNCNGAKRDQMPQYGGRKGKRGTLLRPLKPPRQPTTAELLRAGMECLDPTIKEDFASWLHWNVPLET